jgi:hypothetical protein
LPVVRALGGADIHLITDEELAEILGLSVPEVRRFCREKGWPCVRPKRNIWRFTEAHVEQIVASLTKEPKGVTRSSTPTIPGQTARSAASHRNRQA